MKNQDSILLFGASGQIGKSIIRKFTKNNYRVIAVTRSIHRKGYQIKTQANYGYLELEEINSFSEEKISCLMSRASICINLIGILYEKRKNHFKNIHTDFYHRRVSRDYHRLEFDIHLDHYHLQYIQKEPTLPQSFSFVLQTFFLVYFGVLIL